MLNMRAVHPTRSGTAGSPTSPPRANQQHPERLVGHLAGADHDLVALLEDPQRQRHAREQHRLLERKQRQLALDVAHSCSRKRSADPILDIDADRQRVLVEVEARAVVGLVQAARGVAGSRRTRSSPARARSRRPCPRRPWSAPARRRSPRPPRARRRAARPRPRRVVDDRGVAGPPRPSAWHWSAEATPRAMRRMRSGRLARRPSSKLRSVPCQVTSSGITLKASPPWIEPIVSTAEASGGLARHHALKGADHVRRRQHGIGRAVRRAAVAAAAAHHDAQRRPRPSAVRVSRRACRPSAHSRGARPATLGPPSSAPSRSRPCAPPSPSSAGWNTNAAAAGQRAGRPAGGRRPQPIATWPSWPHACCALGRRRYAARSLRGSAARPCPRAA